MASNIDLSESLNGFTIKLFNKLAASRGMIKIFLADLRTPYFLFFIIYFNFMSSICPNYTIIRHELKIGFSYSNNYS